MFLVDGSNLLWRTVKVPNLLQLSYNGKITGPMFATIRAIISLIKFYKMLPIVVFDKGLSKRRLNLHRDYKYAESNAIRRQDPNLADFWTIRDRELQIYRESREKLRVFFEYLGIPVLQKEGYEGDDLIAICSQIYNNISFVVSEDKDFIQLLDKFGLLRCIQKEYITQSIPSIKLPKGYKVVYLKDMGFENPKEYVYYRGFLGDTSDNIPGVKGIGEVNAKKFISMLRENDYDISKLINSLDVSKKINKIFIENLKSYLLSLELFDLSKVEVEPEIVEYISTVISSSKNKKTDFDNSLNFLIENGMKEIIKDFGDLCYLIESYRGNLNV